MPHTEGNIEEPQVQGDPQGVDYQALYQKYYDKGFDVDKATRKIRILYGAGEAQVTALTDFYASKKKVKTDLQHRSPVRKRFLRTLPQIRLLREGKRVEIRLLL